MPSKGGRPELLRALSSVGEKLLWGGRIREEALVWLLRQHYQSLFRRVWKLARTPPHFNYHRLMWFLFGFSTRQIHPYQFARAFYAAELLRPEDIVLDIGCGDGFLTNHFLSRQCAEVDALDVDPKAIQEAKRNNSRANIAYYLQSAVTDAFPRNKYDVIVWNGAIGHLATNDAAVLLQKIANALQPHGIFAGSESLGHEGSDHLQFYNSTDELKNLFQSHFANVWTKALPYPINEATFVREEAYWKCSNSGGRLAESAWQPNC